MSFTKLLLSSVVALTLSGNAVAQVLIDASTRNGSFELLGGVQGVAKATHWDTDPDGDVDSWTDWAGVSTANNDSGADASGAASDGTRVAFLQNANAAYNLTDYTIQLGDRFTYSWDWVLAGRGPAIAGLAYDNGGTITAIGGADTTNPDATMPHLGLGMLYEVLAGNPAIGKKIALTVSSTGNYPEVDNFYLAVNIIQGDVNGDGIADLADYAIIRNNFRTSVASQSLGDLTRDGVVNFADFIAWRDAALPSAVALASLSAVPEPASCLLVVLGFASVMGGRFRRA